MVNGAARDALTLETLLSDFMKRFQILESNLRDRRGFSSTETKPIGTSSGASSAGITGFLKDSGDQMVGPLAFAPAVNTIVNGEIDISLDLNLSYTSYILLNPEAGVTDTLDRIQGAAFPGQIVTFQITNASVIFSNVDNIQGNDIEVQAGNTISFIFDASLDQQWKAWSGAGGGAGSFPILYPIDDFGDQGAVNLIIDISGTSGQNKRIRMTGNIGFQFTGEPENKVLEEFWITFQQDSTGNRELTATVPSSVKNVSQLNVLLDKTANAKTTFHFLTEDGGVSYRADLVDLSSGEFFGPWTGDHNAGKKGLTNLQFLDIVNSEGSARAVLSGLFADETKLSIPLDHKFVIREHITDVLEVDSNGLKILTNKVINMSKSIINTVGSIEFDRTQNFNPTTILALGFDLQSQSMLYNMPLTSDSHRFRSGGENLCTISRIGSNQGQVDSFSIAGDIHTIRAQAFFGSAPTPSPLLNGAVWRDDVTGLFQFRQNGLTVDLGGAGGFLPLSGGTMSGAINLDNNDLLDVNNIEMHQNGFIRANNAIAPFAIQLDNVAAIKGSKGMIAIPSSDITTVVTVPLLDAVFGNHQSSIGLDINNLTPSTLWVRKNAIVGSGATWVRFTSDFDLVQP